MAKLPQQLNLDMMQNRWATILEPIINNPVNNSVLLKNVPIITGTNVINHKLGRNLQGWMVTRMRSVYAQLYDLQDSNQIPGLTLVLVSDQDLTIDLVVF